MFPVLQIGHVAIQTPGLIVILGLWIALDISERFFLKAGIPSTKAYTLVTIGLVAAIAGGRLSYAAENLPAFAASPASLISLNLNLWDAPGGILLGLAGCALYGQRQKISFWPLLDSLTPALAVMAIAIHLANLASGSAFGEAARLPWSIYLWGEWRHPSQIYEAIGALGVLGWVLLRFPGAYARSLPQFRPGVLFLEFVIGSAGLRLFFEMFRGDSSLLIGQIRAAQAAAWIILGIGLFLRGKRSAQPATAHEAG